MTIPRTTDDWRPWAAARLNEIISALLFSTRLPLPRAAPTSAAALAQAIWALPLAGILVGIIGAVVYGVAGRVGLPAWPAAALTIAATLAVTGCLHEDGLADTADGFGGGETREQKLTIMRDARIGTFGVCALALSILLRVSALADLDPVPAAWALIAAHGGARAMLPVFMFLVAPARSDGLSSAAGMPSREQALAAAVIGILILAICLGVGAAVLAVIVLTIVAVLTARLSLAQIGGQTGDVLGALEQIGEIVILLVAVR